MAPHDGRMCAYYSHPGPQAGWPGVEDGLGWVSWVTDDDMGMRPARAGENWDTVGRFDKFYVQWQHEEGLQGCIDRSDMDDGENADRARYRAWQARQSVGGSEGVASAAGAGAGAEAGAGAFAAGGKPQARTARRRRGKTATVASSPSPSPVRRASFSLVASWQQRLASYSAMTGDTQFDAVLTFAAIMVCTCLCAELSASTAYGKFSSAAIVSISARTGWWMLELPVTISILYFFFAKSGPQAHLPVPRVMAAIMCFHYCYRGWIFPCVLLSSQSSARPP